MTAQRALCSLLLLTCAALAALPAWPQAPARLEVEGVRGLASVLVPLRETARFLDYTQSWDPATDIIRLEGPAGILDLTPGSREVVHRQADGDEGRTVALAEAPRFSGPYLHVPFPDILEAAGVEGEVVAQDATGMEFADGDRAIHARLLSDEEIGLVEQAAGSVVKLQTTKGDIYLELFERKAPITAGSFLDLVASGFYDGLTFHRVIANFMIQGGCPRGDGTGGPGFTIPDEADRGLEHLRGSLSMAKTPEPHTAGSQFFICHRPQPHLDGVHSVFGQCIAGMNVVDRIEGGDVMTRALILKLTEFAHEAVAIARAARMPTRHEEAGAHD